MRLRICAFLAFAITNTTAFAQDAQVGLDATSQTVGLIAQATATGGIYDDAGMVLLGHVKAAPLCPPYCAPRRVSSPEQATVGEREVMTFTMAAAATGPKLHVDSRRSTWARMEKLPSAVSAAQAPTAVTRNEFRPALDPVLAEPTTEPTE